METATTNFKLRLGIFVATGIFLFVLGIFYIGKQKSLFNQVITVKALFKNVSGLQVGNNVRFSGINIGTVDEITIINDSLVRVNMLINKSVQPFMKTDAKVFIGSEGIIGDRILSISQGGLSQEVIHDGTYLISEEPVETDAILASLQVTAENAEVISGELAEIFYSINNGKGTLGRLIKDTTIAANLDQTIVNLKRGTRGLDENMEAAKSNFLLRGYYKKKEKERKEKEEQIKKEMEKDKKK